jgi:phosphosulfolactate phosphohydrolase-like enzyme
LWRGLNHETRNGKMKIHLEQQASGAARAARRGDVVIVVDALRASVTITLALALGAERVIPVLTVDAARGHRGRANRLVAGERGGAKLPGFDLGNSPTQLLAHADQVCGKTLILTTSHGTRAILAARGGSAAVLIGALPNAATVTHVARSIAERMQRDISLVAAGSGAKPAPEDDYAIAVLAARISGDPPPPQAPLDVFQASPNARRLSDLGYTDDVILCAEVDRLDVVPILRGTAFETFPLALFRADAAHCGEPLAAPGPEEQDG